MQRLVEQGGVKNVRKSRAKDSVEGIQIDKDRVGEGKRVSCWPKKVNGAKNIVRGDELKTRRKVSFESKNDEKYLECGDVLELLQG